jgi:virginiamycin B lyase
MWFVELAGQMDGRKVDGNRVGRITMDGKVTEYPIPSQAGSPINIAVGPDSNIWFTKGGIVGRVTSDGAITEFPMSAPNVGGTGLTAGSDRQPPRRLANRLWVAASGGNRLAYLQFK